MEIMEINNTSKNINNFYCKKCDFNCIKKGDYNRHLLTAKHKKEINGNNIIIKNINSYECVNCNKFFKTNSGLWKHEKKCKLLKKEDQEHDL